jgi:hypothetical protein
MTLVLPDTSKNTSFSKESPLLQLAIDSTSLGEVKTCMRKYFYSVVWGYQPKSTKVDLIFGIWMHEGSERYQHAKAKGLGHNDCLDVALDHVLRSTWNKELGRPWASGDSYKNRLTLVRTLVWYLDQYGEHDSLETIILANGKPAVELSFSFDVGFHTFSGERIQYCGHLDRLAEMNGQRFIPDLKTTKSDISPHYWAQFNPSNQFGMYSLAGQVAFNVSVRGIVVDAAQVLVNSSRFARQLIPKDEASVDEWFRGSLWWLRLIEDAAKDGLRHGEAAYPMNDKSCGMWGGCPFQSICARSPGARQQWLASEFNQRVWDPLQRRGDI